MSHPEPVDLRDAEALDAVLTADLAVIYKHSPVCFASTRALREVRAFLASSPEVSVYRIDVVRDRDLSREVERRLEIRHESPQALVLRNGEVVWHGSHGAVTAVRLGRETS